jgi:lipoic acid synthetase
VLTKTSLMLGLGETDEEIREALDDLRAAGVDIVTFGQYLQPTAHHHPIERYVTPEEFATYREWGLERGSSRWFRRARALSYRAEQVLAGNNVGLG